MSVGVIDGLIDEGTLETVVLPAEAPARPPDPDLCGARFLSRRKRRPAWRCASACATAAISVTLLDGVTGSGKTEVYFEAVAEAMRARTPEPHPDAGDRAHRAVARPLRGAVRRAAGGMAFGS